MPRLDEMTQGERIAYYRRQLGLSQAELASRVARSESWVGQVERGSHLVDRWGVLRSLADALQVSILDIQPDTPRRLPNEQHSELGVLRLALAKPPALASVFTPAGRSAEEATAEDRAKRGETARPALMRLQTDVDKAMEKVHATELADAAPLLADLVLRLEDAAVGEPAAYELLAGTYQGIAAMFSRVGEADAAWVAADRSVVAAYRAGDPGAVVAGLFRVLHAFHRLRRYDQADSVMEAIHAVVGPLADDPDAPIDVLSAYGACILADATAKAAQGNRRAARAAIRQATALAARVGPGRNDHSTEFGPDNVQLHALTVAVELGDAGEALDLAAALDPSTTLSAERQGRYWLEVARAHAQLRQAGEGTQALLKAEEVAPEQTLKHPLARQVMIDLLDRSRHPRADLAELAARAGLLPE